jgi:hypothetical protein
MSPSWCSFTPGEIEGGRGKLPSSDPKEQRADVGARLFRLDRAMNRAGGHAASGNGTNNYAVKSRGHWQMEPLQDTFKIAMERFPRR